MNNKHISKITLLSCLMVGSMVNAETFYQCVPNSDWFKKQQELIMDEKFNRAKKVIHDGLYWNYVGGITGVLPIGIYKVEIAGGAGGNGGDAGAIGHGFGYGGSGEIKIELFKLKEETKFYLCTGLQGKNGSDGRDGGSGGGGGAGSAFKLENGSVEIRVSGGGGGGGDSGGYGGGGGGGGGYGCAEGGMGGYGDDYPSRGEGGKITGIISLSKYGVKGHAGNEDSGYIGGDGGNSEKNCAKGGKGGSNYDDGDSGSTCASSGNGNSGDGYVKIYKYIG